MKKDSNSGWDLLIEPKKGLFDINLGDIWRYRDLILLFVKRDFVVLYKQTILGPLWYLIQPIFTTFVFTMVFGKMAKLSTDGIPPFLFYMSGTIAWNYFASSLNGTSNTFINNASIFGKVYFPRLVIPISTVIINMAQFLIQLILFLLVYIYYISAGFDMQLTMWLVGIPFALLQMACLGLGVGILISSFTTKYRDLVFLMTFGVQLWMYATPVVYPASMIPKEYLTLYMLNPMVSIIETFRIAFLGQGTLEVGYYIQSWAITIFILIVGILSFHKVERSFMDTV
ncbi:ABC transporter permease [Leptospira sp. WS60.C2]